MKTVLVVDDEDDIRLLARMVLEGASFGVIEAADGAAALDTLEHQPVDLVLLDLRMAGIDGWDVIDRLRAAGRLPGLAVIVLSAHADPSTAAEVKARGCRAYVSKPFRPDELLGAVRVVAGNNGH